MKTKEVLAILKTLTIPESERPVFNIVIQSLEQEKKDSALIYAVTVGMVIGVSFLLLIGALAFR
jgi:uncharacterized membrane-anchored protein YitT (DUF2179 family)